jgi:hypothetical protein
MSDGLRHGQVLQPVAPHEGLVEPEPLGVVDGGKKKKAHGKGLTEGDEGLSDCLWEQRFEN